MKILYFFLFLWVIFALLDPDPDPATQINADRDPKPCLKEVKVLEEVEVFKEMKVPDYVQVLKEVMALVRSIEAKVVSEIKILFEVKPGRVGGASSLTEGNALGEVKTMDGVKNQDPRFL
jgi:hypothetical protein